MRVRKLSPTGDFTFGSSLLNFWIDSPEGVAQIVKTGLLLIQTEWYLDTSKGTPWFSGVLGKFPEAQATADSLIQDQISHTQGVTGVPFFQSLIDPVTRGYSVQTTISTQFGPATLSVPNIQGENPV